MVLKNCQFIGQRYSLPCHPSNVHAKICNSTNVCAQMPTHVAVDLFHFVTLLGLDIVDLSGVTLVHYLL